MSKKDPSSELEAAIDLFVQGAGKISSALLGMVNKVGGQIYALLFLSEEPLSLDEISKRLEVSKSNVSINIRMLEDYKLVRKVWVKGSRKDYYEAERIYPKKVIVDFVDKIQRTINDAITIIEQTRALATIAKTKLSDKSRAEFVLEQLDLVGSFYYGAQQFIDSFLAGKDVDMDLLRYALTYPEKMQHIKKT